MKCFSVKWKIILASGLCLLITSVSLLSFSLYSAKQSQTLINERTLDDFTQVAERLLVARSEAEIEKIIKPFDEAHTIGQMLSQEVMYQKTHLQEHNLKSAALRTDLNTRIRQIVELYGDLLGAYVIFEPNQLDGNDAEYIDSASLGSNDIGRFARYWAREPDGTITPEAILEKEISNMTPDQNGIQSNEWYACSIRTQESCLLEPYLNPVGDTEQLMTSLTLPLKEDNKVKGMLGIDLSLTGLQKLVTHMDSELFDGQGEVLLVSRSGLIAGTDRDSAFLGGKISADATSQIDTLNKWLRQDQEQLAWSADGSVLQMFKPVTFGLGNKGWGLYISLPREVILAKALSLGREVKTQQQENMLSQVVAGLLFIGLAMLLLWVLAGTLVAPIKVMAARLKDIAEGEGDLTQEINIKQQDETGELALWFNLFQKKLRSTVSDVVVTVESTRSTATQSADVALRTSEGVMAQHREVEMVATAFEEINATTHEMANNITKAANAANSADLAAKQGKAVLTDNMIAMGELKQLISEAQPVVTQLEQDSENINSILEVIQGIAEQTNLLALNAAIEAARAGDQGRGFAVVADEVRALAGRTQNSIEQIRTMIERLHKGTNAVVKVMMTGNDKTLYTERKVNESMEMLEQILDAVGSIHEMNHQNANAADDLSAAFEEINRNVSNICNVSHAITGEAESAARIGEELTLLADQQQQLVGQFKV
ncbi:methyl-accepting chemotaxis protein [Photobacterium lipolyticum]|uniref:Methyl-accepting chemotaxis protein n=1 Tax=Photobacterium lipolyticum TaxID=266810 RepID=A0A2T3N1T0_9GAMM|nr:methyl-accepting chemotaxis protein [Photobacterium lipolyticum]PSW06144.1 methyl-accepting chemotaxis protein [Photobacterium lipolyticum]